MDNNFHRKASFIANQYLYCVDFLVRGYIYLNGTILQSYTEKLYDGGPKNITFLFASDEVQYSGIYLQLATIIKHISMLHQ